MPESPGKQVPLSQCHRICKCACAALMRAWSKFSPQHFFFQVASRWVRVSGRAAPGRLEGAGTAREQGAKNEIRKDPAANSQQCLASPSTPSQHLLPVALFSPATSTVRVTAVFAAGVYIAWGVWCPLAYLTRERSLTYPNAIHGCFCLFSPDCAA